VDSSPPRDLSPLRLLGLLAAFIGLVMVLGRVDPFAALNARLVGAETRMQPTIEDPAHIDPRHGDDLARTLAELAPARQAGKKWIVVFGNSQQYTASLPRGATPDLAREAEIATSLLGKALDERAPGAFHVYNASAPNQNHAEALWHALYWFEASSPAPAALVLQASFDTFRKTAIRPGYQTLLDEPRYAAALAAFVAARGEREYISDFRAAERDHAERAAEKEEADPDEYRQWSPEPSLRAGMDHVALFKNRETLRSSFLNTLYALRAKGLGISPTTRRHITGAPYEQNIAALADLIDLAQRHGAKVMLYNAPVNPAVSMFYEDEYAGFVARLVEISSAKDVPFVDLAAAVPAERWGYWIDGPDPIHFDEQAHYLMRDHLVAAFAGPLLALAQPPRQP
jgi:hypothetical protein